MCISVSVSPFIIYLCVVDLVAGVVLVVRVIPNLTIHHLTVDNKLAHCKHARCSPVF